MKKRYAFLIFLIILLCAVLTACTGNTSSSIKKPKQTEAQAQTGTHLAVIEKIDRTNESITFFSYTDNQRHAYPYNDGTNFYKKDGTMTVMESLNPGDVVDMVYTPDSCIIQTLTVSKNNDVWENTKVTNFSVYDNTKSLRIGQSLYAYTENTVVYSDGELISMMQLTKEDQLVVRGKGTEIISVVVTKGHGYVSLSGDTLFIGGYIDIGGEVVKVIEEDMLLVVQEGDYKVEVRNGKYVSEKMVSVTRNRKSVVDFSDVSPDPDQVGNLKVSVDVKTAVITVDGKTVTSGEILTLPIGKHTVKVTAEGYTTYTKTINLTINYMELEVKLNEATSEPESTTRENETSTEQATTSQATTSQNTTTASGSESFVNSVTIQGPVGGYIYFDGAYKGVAPVVFGMVAGEHIITIIYDGEIKSFTVNLVEGSDDVEYDFTQNVTGHE